MYGTMNPLLGSICNQSLKRQRNADRKSPHCSAMEVILSIMPSKLVRDGACVDDRLLDLVKSRLQELLCAVGTVKEMQLGRITRNETEETKKVSIVPYFDDNQSCQNDIGFGSTPMSPQVLQQLAMRDFLSAGDLGNLLLKTSKSFMTDLGEDFVFSHLCRRRWRNSQAIPSVVKEKGYIWLYHKMSLGAVQPRQHRTFPVVPSPMLSPDNLALLVNVHSGSDEMLSEVLTGDALQDLFHCGRSFVPLTNPILIGDFPIETDGCVNPPSVEFEDWSATMHAVRLDNNRCCAVHQSSDVWWYFEGDENERVGNLHFSPELTGLELTNEGKVLESRIRKFDRALDNQPFGGIYLEATVISSSSISPTDPTKMRFTFDKLKVEIWSIYAYAGDVYHSGLEAKTHGVTALHLLDKLEGLSADS